MIAVLLFHAPLPIFAFFKRYGVRFYRHRLHARMPNIHTFACEWCFIVYAIAENIFRRVPLSIGYYDFIAALSATLSLLPFPPSFPPTLSPSLSPSFVREYERTSRFNHFRSDSKVCIDPVFFHYIVIFVYYIRGSSTALERNKNAYGYEEARNIATEC